MVAEQDLSSLWLIDAFKADFEEHICLMHRIIQHTTLKSLYDENALTIEYHSMAAYCAQLIKHRLATFRARCSENLIFTVRLLKQTDIMALFLW